MEVVPILLAALVLLALIGLGIPVAFALGIAGFLGLVLSEGLTFAVVYVQVTSFWSVYGYTLAIVPLFILMGNLLGGTEILTSLFKLMQRFLGRVRGGVALIVVIMSAVFAACSGSSVAACGVFTPIALPSMKKLGYSSRFSAGLIASSATVAVMIPPSITMVVYGIITETSIGPLLIGGVIPGLLNVAIYMVAIFVMVSIKPELAPSRITVDTVKADQLEWGKSIVSLGAILLMIVIVIGGIYSGIFTPSQAGAAGAFVAFLVYLWSRPKQRGETGLLAILIEVGTMTGVVLGVLIGAIIFARFLELSGFIDAFVNFIGGLPIPPLGVFFMLVLVYLILGQLFDPMSMLVVTLPIFFPLVVKLGFHPIWFGVVVVQLVEIGVLSPPMGLNVFTVSSATKGMLLPEEIFRGVMPFLLLELSLLMLLILFPSIVLWLPGKMMG